jgi:hypothetical protein
MVVQIVCFSDGDVRSQSIERSAIGSEWGTGYVEDHETPGWGTIPRGDVDFGAPDAAINLMGVCLPGRARVPLGARRRDAVVNPAAVALQDNGPT